MRVMTMIASGIFLLGLLLFFARRSGLWSPAQAARLFIPLWFAASVLNSWFGAAQTYSNGYVQLALFLLTYGVPAVVAAYVVRRTS